MREIRSHSDLATHWLISFGFLLILMSYIIISHVWGKDIQMNLEESQRILIRSVLYALTIFLFPIVKLLRHILLRLNLTMPGKQSAKQRYLVTIAVTLSLIETVGFFGFVMFILGDDFNSLYIFSILAALGLFLHMPKLSEYLAICRAVEIKNND